MVRAAAVLIRRLKIDQAEFDAEEAANYALSRSAGSRIAASSMRSKTAIISGATLHVSWRESSRTRETARTLANTAVQALRLKAIIKRAGARQGLTHRARGTTSSGPTSTLIKSPPGFPPLRTWPSPERNSRPSLINCRTHSRGKFSRLCSKVTRTWRSAFASMCRSRPSSPDSDRFDELTFNTRRVGNRSGPNKNLVTRARRYRIAPAFTSPAKRKRTQACHFHWIYFFEIFQGFRCVFPYTQIDRLPVASSVSNETGAVCLGRRRGSTASRIPQHRLRFVIIVDILNLIR